MNELDRNSDARKGLRARLLDGSRGDGRDSLLRRIAHGFRLGWERVHDELGERSERLRLHAPVEPDPDAEPISLRLWCYSPSHDSDVEVSVRDGIVVFEGRVPDRRDERS